MGSEGDRPERGLASYRAFVRSQLKRYGVSAIDLEDLTQEVWLVALARSPNFSDDRATRTWLSQVCRRIAAGERRTRARTPMLKNQGELELPVEPDQNEHIERDFDEQKSMAALTQLTEEQLDVLALYGSGELSMREVADLVGEPEGTVYSRYRSAIDEVSRALRRSERIGPKLSSAPPPPVHSSHPPSLLRSCEEAADHGELIFYRRDEQLVIGRVGNVVISQWRKRVFEQSAADVGATIKMVAEHLRSRLVMVNVAPSDLALPNAKERGALRHYIRACSRDIVMAVDIWDTRLARVLSAIMAGLLSITRTTQVQTFAVVPTVEAARRFLEPHARTVDAPLSWQRVEQAIYAVRDAS